MKSGRLEFKPNRPAAVGLFASNGPGCQPLDEIPLPEDVCKSKGRVAMDIPAMIVGTSRR